MEPSLYLLFHLLNHLFLPIPADPLLIALGLGKTKRAFYYAFICTLASVLGMFGYLIGEYIFGIDSGYSDIAMYIFNNIPWITKEAEGAQNFYKCYDFYAIFLAAFTPIPYKSILLSVQEFYVNLSTFIIASILGRGLRFLYGERALVWFFGPGVKAIMDKYFNWFIIILTIVFTLSYFLIDIYQIFNYLLVHEKIYSIYLSTFKSLYTVFYFIYLCCKYS